MSLPRRPASGLHRTARTSTQAYAYLVVAVLVLLAIFLGRSACSRRIGDLFGVATDPGTRRSERARDAGIRPPDAGRPASDDW